MKNSILFGTTDFLSVQRCFVYAQNSPSTVVHGCTTVEDGSNGLTVPMILRFSSILSDAFTRLPKKMCKILFKILHRQATVAYNAESSLNILYFAILCKIPTSPQKTPSLSP